MGETAHLKSIPFDEEAEALRWKMLNCVAY